MNIFLMRHAQAESGDREDPTRGLTDKGKHEIEVMGEFMSRQIGRVDCIITSYFSRARKTAEGMGHHLGCDHIIDIPELTPNWDAKQAWKAVNKAIPAPLRTEDAEVLIVSHHPLINKLLELETGCKTGDEHFGHAHIAALKDSKLHWFVGPKLVERDELKVAEASIAIADAMLAELGVELHFDEATKRQYYYDIQNVKRWVLGDGGRAGNCEICVENADLGDVDDDATFLSVLGDIDDGEAHPNCTCSVEYREKRVRVYV